MSQIGSLPDRIYITDTEKKKKKNGLINIVSYSLFPTESFWYRPFLWLWKFWESPRKTPFKKLLHGKQFPDEYIR